MAVFESLGTLQEFVRRTNGSFRNCAEHLSQLECARLTGQLGEAGERTAILNDFLHLEVLVTVGGQLWQVGDDHDLMSAAQVP